MKLKERRYNLIFSRLRDIILDSEWDIGVSMPSHKLSQVLEKDFGKDEITYAIRHLVSKEYVEDDGTTNLILTRKGYEEWLFPEGLENPKRVFISHASQDKKFAVRLKKLLEDFGFTAFVAHEDIPATAEWRDKIISELKGSGIFLALRTKNYIGKQFAEQECGFALALEKRILSLCIDTPTSSMGFCAAFQGKFFDLEAGKIPVSKIGSYLKKQLTD